MCDKSSSRVIADVIVGIICLIEIFFVRIEPGFAGGFHRDYRIDCLWFL